MSIRYEQYESGDGYEESPEAAGTDREISLGTATVLGIFLGLALVCALFFGFGYSMGRKSVPSALANVSTGVSAPLPDSRPTPGSLPNSNVGGAAYVPPVERGTGDSLTTDTASGAKAPAGQRLKPAAATVSTDAEPVSAASVAAVQRQQVAHAVEVARTAPTDAPKSPVAERATMPGTAPGGTTYVQVTAISAAHRGDAEMLVSSLKRKGYAAAIRPGAADDLLHVQMGPFATKKDAEAMRQRLSSDGYNSILK